MSYVIEHLTWRTWCLAIMPRLLIQRLRGGGGACCEVVDGSPAGWAVARWTAGLVGASVTRLTFCLMDIRDEAGLSIRLRVAYRDLAEVQAQILGRFSCPTRPANRVHSFLAQSVVALNKFDHRTLFRALLVIQICVWRRRQRGEPAAPHVLFLEQRPWMHALIAYGARWGLQVVGVEPPIEWRAWMRWILTPQRKRWLRVVHAAWHTRRTQAASASGRSTVAVEYYGHLNLDHHERYSDLFFWQRSSLHGRQVLVLFHLEHDPLDAAKRALLGQREIGAVAIRPQAAAPGVPVFLPRWRLAPHGVAAPSVSQAGPFERAWLREHWYQYQEQRALWREVFAAQGVKVYLSWFKYDGSHCVIADALQELGGVTAIYQRAYEELPTVEAAIDADIVFGFSPKVAEIERRSGSRIPYHVAVGYSGDHRFPLLRAQAEQVRAQLLARGARRILAFCDENSGDDGRWHTPHEVPRAHYAFLLERLLATPWLGLVLKPKVPITLRRRLGPVAELLTQAEATGRCFVYEGGALHGSYPPAAAALTADVAVHGHLCAGTAGVECALTGVPTLLMDKEGWSISPLYQLGVGRVVFRDWEVLWKTCVDHWSQPGGVPGFGDWSPILNDVDPFRDGRAAERLGTYVHWLLEGFKAGKTRETVMAEAAERYAAQWGADKIQAVNISHPGRGNATPNLPEARGLIEAGAFVERV